VHLGSVGLPAVTRQDQEAPGLPRNEAGSLKEAVQRQIQHVEREMLIKVLGNTGGNKTKAARILQIDYKTIRTKAKQYGIPLA
jgi:two-component system nitrogen regulation response regulator GlnG